MWSNCPATSILKAKFRADTTWKAIVTNRFDTARTNETRQRCTPRKSPTDNSLDAISFLKMKSIEILTTSEARIGYQVDKKRPNETSPWFTNAPVQIFFNFLSSSNRNSLEGLAFRKESGITSIPPCQTTLMWFTLGKSIFSDSFPATHSLKLKFRQTSTTKNKSPRNHFNGTWP